MVGWLARQLSNDDEVVCQGVFYIFYYLVHLNQITAEIKKQISLISNLLIHIGVPHALHSLL